MKLSEKDLMTDWLTAEKSLVGSYATFLTELSNNKLRDTVKCCMESAADRQFEVYSKMSEKGFYATEPAESGKVTTEKSKFKSIGKELCSCHADGNCDHKCEC